VTGGDGRAPAGDGHEPFDPAVIELVRGVLLDPIPLEQRTFDDATWGRLAAVVDALAEAWAGRDGPGVQAVANRLAALIRRAGMGVRGVKNEPLGTGRSPQPLTERIVALELEVGRGPTR
jgi:hypothetical protein